MERGILFVDDEELILSSLKRELRSWLEARHLTFFQAHSGAEAIDFLSLNHRQVLVLVTDLRMPVISGDALVAETRRRWPAIESVLISGYAEMQGLARAVAAGIRSFVPKPWEPETLTAELEKALGERERIRIAGVRTNELTYQLTRTREMQKTLFRNDQLNPARFRSSLLYRPLADQFCGGDFYEIVSLGADRCVVLLGDVSGHGSEAAFFTGVIHTLIVQDEIFNLLSGSASAGYLLRRLNQLVFDHLSIDQSRSVALSVLLFDRETGRVQVSNAGGLPLILVRQGKGTAHHVQGLPLGLAPDTAYPVLSVDCQPGDQWVVMTDGLVDRGQSGFVPGPEVVRTVVDGLADGDLEAVLQGFQAAAGGKPFLDDLTILSLEVV